MVLIWMSTLLQARDPWFEPFHENSIWNHPIGSGAQLVDAQLGAESEIDIEVEYMFQTNWSDAAEDIHNPTNEWIGRWPGTFAWWLGKMHVPHNVYIEDSEPGYTPNNCASFLMPDKTTLVQLNAATRLRNGAQIVGYRSPNVFLYGMGIRGEHGGSYLSNIGGTIRGHEWGSNKTINHALKILVDTFQYLNYTSSNQGYRWPASRADAYAADVYGGSVGAMRMGSLLTFQPGTDYSDIGGLSTWQAKKIFDAIYNYGAYVVDDTAWPSYSIAAEDGVNIPTENSSFRSDMNKIFQALYVVNNNSENNIGGGGTVRTSKKSSLGAPDGGEITLQAKANGKFIVAEWGGAGPLLSNRNGVGGWETFEVVDAGNGYIALRSLANSKYVTVRSGDDVLIAAANSINDWERFQWVYKNDGKYIALKAKKNNKYVSVNTSTLHLIANKNSAGNNEKFTPGGGTGVWNEYGNSSYNGVPGQ
ncbi:MAG: hypothetical protein AAF558_05385 [Verrucomicrobiota bacterium]